MGAHPNAVRLGESNFVPGRHNEYFDHIDRRFLEALRLRHYLPWHRLPFEQLIPYDELRDLDVLEIGMTFADQSFDFVWSSGVIHHPSNTLRVVREMARVLRPGGKAVVMVYYCSPIQYYLLTGLGRGFLKGEFGSVGGIHRINQAATDGALARFFSIPEFSKLAQGMFVIDKTVIAGKKVDAFPIPHGRLKSFLLANTADYITRFVTNVLRLETFLIVRLNRT